MNLTLTDEQEMLTKMARSFMVKRFPHEVLDQIDETGLGYSPEIWQEMAELGWMGLVLPEEFDGAGMEFQDLALLLEEIGRVRRVSPFFSTVILGALPLLDLGTEEQKRAVLPAVAAGECILTLALLEGSARYDAEGVALQARADGDDWVLDGAKLFVPDAHLADRLLVVARTGAGRAPQEGVTVFLIDAQTPGVTITPQKALDESVVCRVAFAGVRVPATGVLGEVGAGWPAVRAILDRAAVARCCEMTGAAQRVLEIAVQYAKDREQFGRLIGTFQSIQHHCANMLSDVDASRMITYEAAWRVSAGMPHALEAAMAKAWVTEAYRRVVMLGHQVSGGSGLIIEHDMPRYFKDSKVAEVTFGDARFNRRLVAERLGYDVAPPRP